MESTMTGNGTVYSRAIQVLLQRIEKLEGELATISALNQVIRTQKSRELLLYRRFVAELED